MHFLLVAACLGQSAGPSADVGPLVRALWLVQRDGTSQAMSPQHDQRVKGVLSKALAKDGVITLPELGGFMEPGPFKELAGPDGKLDASEIQRGIEAATPEGRTKLVPKLREHADYLTTTFDLIDE